MTITHRLDLIKGPNNVEEGWKTIELPAVPAPNEALRLDGELLTVLARGYEIQDGKLTVGLLVGRPNQPIIPVGAEALQILGAGARG